MSSDVLDCQWLQQLHSYGLLPGSFRPGKDICQLRTYTRQRETLIRYAAYHIRHMQKTFDATSYLQQLTGVDLTKIDGLSAPSALRIIAEIGTDMTKWKTAKHFGSWLGLAPGTKISGGKVLSSKTKPSANRAAALLRVVPSTLHRSHSALGAFLSQENKHRWGMQFFNQGVGDSSFYFIPHDSIGKILSLFGYTPVKSTHGFDGLVIDDKANLKPFRSIFELNMGNAVNQLAKTVEDKSFVEAVMSSPSLQIGR